MYVIEIFSRIYRDLGGIPVIGLQAIRFKRSTDKRIVIEYILPEEIIFLLEERIFFRETGEVFVVEYVECEGFGEVFIFIGKSISGDKVADFLAFFLGIEGFPGDGIEDVGRIREDSFFQIKDIHDMPEFMDEYFELFGVVGDGRREDELIPDDLATWLDTLGIEEQVEWSDL